jgi:2-methylcitrate dehydratase
MALEQTRLGELSIWKGGAAPNAARNAVFAALLAREGFTGPDEAIEGRWGLWHKVGKFEWAPFGGRGGPFRVTRTHLKNYPAVLHAQSPITAALQLHGQFAIDDVEKVSIDSYWVANRYLDRSSPDWNPATRETADHSIPYLVAAALMDGRVSEATFDERHLRDPRLRALITKTTITERADYTVMYPDGCPCRIEVLTRAGERKTAETRYFRGHAKNPLTDDEVEAKFRRLGEGVLAPHRVDAMLEKLWRCEKLQHITDVLDLFVVEESSR